MKATVIAAWAERCSGPGWANAPVWVLVREPDGTLRQDCLQPKEQPADMVALFRVSAAVASDMRRLAERALAKRGSKR